MEPVKMVGFRRISKDPPKPVFKRYSLEEAAVVVVLLHFAGSTQDRAKIDQVEDWLKMQPDIQLIKLTKREAFVQTYIDLMRQPQPVFFISPLPADQLEDEPLLLTYKLKLQQEGRLQEVLTAAKDNIQRIRFIILKQDIEEVAKLNYYHAGVALITERPELVKIQIERVLDAGVRLKAMTSSSSINSEEVDRFAGRVEQKIGEGVKLISPQKNNEEEFQVWQAKSQTPGVGSYQLADKVKIEGFKMSPSKSRSQQMQETNPNQGSGQKHSKFD